MQFLESSIIGLRSAFYEFKSKDRKLTFILCPMVHIADPLFYKEVQKKIDKSDNLIFEGVKSKKSWFLVQSYRVIAKNKSLGLVLQSKVLMLKNEKVNLIHGDIDTEDFNSAWKTIPFFFRVFILILAPIYGWIKYFTISRDELSKNKNVESLTRSEELENDEKTEKFMNVILDERDKILLDVIDKHIVKNGDKEECTTIIYGASHMPAVTSLLIEKYDYKVTNSEWVQVL